MKPRISKHGTTLLLILLTSLFPIAACTWDQGLLWRLESPAGRISYLFGTIHLEDPRVLDIPAEVAAALEESRTFIMELDTNAEAMAELGQLMRLPATEKLSTHTGQALFEKTALALRGHGLNSTQVDRLQPWAAMMMLSMPPSKTGLFLDMALLARARQAGLGIGGLESVQEQVDVFRTLPVADQVRLLAETVQHIDEMETANRTLLDLYLSRDLAGMLRLNEENMRLGEQQLMEQVYRRLITERNQRMLDRLQPELSQGGAFIAVGALHLPGEDGLLQALNELGYLISRAY